MEIYRPQGCDSALNTKNNEINKREGGDYANMRFSQETNHIDMRGGKIVLFSSTCIPKY